METMIGRTGPGLEGVDTAYTERVRINQRKLGMKQLTESGAVRFAAGIQRFGAHFDLEVLSLPGGSVIAAILWLCASTKGTTKRIVPQTAHRIFKSMS